MRRSGTCILKRVTKGLGLGISCRNPATNLHTECEVLRANCAQAPRHVKDVCSVECGEKLYTWEPQTFDAVCTSTREERLFAARGPISTDRAHNKSCEQPATKFADVGEIISIPVATQVPPGADIYHNTFTY